MFPLSLPVVATAGMMTELITISLEEAVTEGASIVIYRRSFEVKYHNSWQDGKHVAVAVNIMRSTQLRSVYSQVS